MQSRDNNKTKVLFWVEAPYGTGDLNIACRAAVAFLEQGCEVDVVSHDACHYKTDYFDAIKENQDFKLHPLSPYRDEEAMEERLNNPQNRYSLKRQFELNEIVKEKKPDIVITQMYPAGRQEFDSELIPLLSQLKKSSKTNKERKPVFVASLLRAVIPEDRVASNTGKISLASLSEREVPSDILGTAEENQLYRPDSMTGQLMRHLYDAHFVCSDEKILPLTVEKRAELKSGVPLRYTGFLNPSGKPAEAAERNQILVTCGGDWKRGGKVMVDAALGAANLSLVDTEFWQVHREAKWRIRAPLAKDSEELAELQEKARVINLKARSDMVIVEEKINDMAQQVAASLVSVSYGGSTALDVLVAGLFPVASAVRQKYVDDVREQETTITRLERQGLGKYVPMIGDEGAEHIDSHALLNAIKEGINEGKSERFHRAVEGILKNGAENMARECLSHYRQSLEVRRVG